MSTPIPAHTVARTLLTELGKDFTVPVVDFSDAAFQLPDRKRRDEGLMSRAREIRAHGHHRQDPCDQFAVADEHDLVA